MDIATASNIASPLNKCSTLPMRACTRVPRSAARYRQQNPAPDATCATCAANATKEMEHATCSMQQALGATCRHAKWKLQRTARSSAHGRPHDLSVQHPSAKYNRRNTTIARARCTLHALRCVLHVARSSLRVARCTLFVACCTLHALRCVLHVACCTLHVACCIVGTSLWTMCGVPST